MSCSPSGCDQDVNAEGDLVGAIDSCSPSGCDQDVNGEMKRDYGNAIALAGCSPSGL